MIKLNMKRKRVALVLFLIALSGKTLLFSQQSSGQLNAIQTVVPFLTIAPDSRAGAMGDAGVATSPDVYSLHWNPAKFAFIDGNARSWNIIFSLAQKSCSRY